MRLSLVTVAGTHVKDASPTETVPQDGKWPGPREDE